MKQTILTYQNAAETLPDSLLQKSPKWTLAHWCVSIFAASFLIVAVHPEARLNDFDVPNGAETVRVARSLAARGAFADPFASMLTGPTAHVAPVYPFLYSLILRAVGTGYTALHLAWACNVAVFALQMGLLPLVSYRMQLGALPGIIAAVLGTLSLYAPIDTRWESFFAGTLLLVAYLLTERAFRDKNIANTLVAGGVWGTLILTHPIMVLLLAAWLACFSVFVFQAESAKPLRRSVIITGVALLMVSPWIVRNYVHFGAFIFVRDNLGLELYTGNNPCAAADLEANIRSGCSARTHPNPSAAIAAQLAAAGEVPFYRARRREALDWIGTHRGAFLHLTAERFGLFWFPEAERPWEAVLAWMVTLLSFPGLSVIARRNSWAACVLGTTWLLFPLVYYVVPFEPRYRYPIYWTSLLPAGCALAAALRKLRHLGGPGRLANPL